MLLGTGEERGVQGAQWAGNPLSSHHQRKQSLRMNWKCGRQGCSGEGVTGHQWYLQNPRNTRSLASPCVFIGGDGITMRKNLLGYFFKFVFRNEFTKYWISMGFHPLTPSTPCTHPRLTLSSPVSTHLSVHRSNILHSLAYF